MSSTNPQPEAQKVGRELLRSAAGRIAGSPGSDPADSGTRFLKRARAHGIDLDLFWAVSTNGKDARQAVLVVPQAGRTGMIFLSGPGPERLCGDRAAQHADRVEALRGAIEGTSRALGDDLHLLQALPSPDEWWAIEAYNGAGLLRLGELAYLKRPISAGADRKASRDPWPPGVEVHPIRGAGEEIDWPALRTALERSYIDTLDCPGLCALRETPDVIESHRSAGRFDPSLWWIVTLDGRPEGCILLSPNPDTDSVELVYMGLGPDLRGRGLGVRLLETAIDHAGRLGLAEIACAVDRRNEPARAVYARLGFIEFARRTAFVIGTRPGR